MMKRVFAAVLAVLVLTSSAFALSDAEYKRMKKNSPEFARADSELAQVWKEAKKVLGRSDFNALTREQRKWIASGRDAAAEELMDDGMERDEAYAEATRERVKAIRETIDAARRRGSGDKPARRVSADNFYAIYERRDGVFMELNGEGGDMYAKISDGDFNWEGDGTIEAKRIVLKDDGNRRLTLTFSKWEKGHITVIAVKGGGALSRLDGTYNAYKGHM